MGKQIMRATYRYELPFLFCGREYYDSASLVMALVEHWDIGLMAAKRGEIAAFFDYLAEEDSKYQALAEKAKKFLVSLHDVASSQECEMKEDVDYAQLLLAMEPAMPGVPVIRFGEVRGEIYGEEEVAAWVESMPLEQRRMPEVYNPKLWDAWILYVYQAFHLITVKRS